MENPPALRDIGEPRYAGIVLWRQPTGEFSTLIVPEDKFTTEFVLPTKFDEVKQLSGSISAALSRVGGVRVALVKKQVQYEGRDKYAIDIDKDAPGEIEQYHYAPFVPLSPTIGVVSHHTFVNAYKGKEFVVKSVMVNKILNPLCAENINHDLGECCEAEILDPLLKLWDTQDSDPFRWEMPNDFQYLRLKEPLFSEFFTPLPFYNRSIADFVPEKLVSLGFAATPGLGADTLASMKKTKLQDYLRHWLEYFPDDFNTKVNNQTEKQLLATQHVKNPLKVREPKVLKAILVERIKFIEHVIAHKCISIGEYMEHDDADTTQPNFLARVSMWPGLSGGPTIALSAEHFANRQFIGLASGSRAGWTNNVMVSVNNTAFANGYKLFVIPSFGTNVPPLSLKYIEQFRDLVDSLEAIATSSGSKKRRVDNEDEDDDN